MRHLIDPLDFSQQEIASLLDLADRICADPAAYQDVAAHKKLATLFYEPSTSLSLPHIFQQPISSCCPYIPGSFP